MTITLRAGVLNSGIQQNGTEFLTVDTSNNATLSNNLTVTGATNLAVSSGNVGIGTSSPANKLTVSATTATQSIVSTTTGNAAYLVLQNSADSSNAYVYAAGKELRLSQADTSASSIVTISTQNTERMRIDSSGNVGIGTATPFPSTAHPSASQLRVGLTGNYFSQNSAGLGISGAAFVDNAYIKNSTGDFAYITSAKASKVLCNTGSVLFQTSTGTDIADTATSFTTQAEITAAGLLKFNSGYGSAATAYGCRAWVNFNGTGTVAISGSGNVSSITDNASGDYTVNFTTALVDANYSVVGSGKAAGSADGACVWIRDSTTPSSSAVRIITGQPGRSGVNTSTAMDNAFNSIAVFR